MKRIAITPNDFYVEDLENSLVSLKEKRASHVYVRSPFILNNPRLSDLIFSLKKEGFVPVVPFSRWIEFKDSEVVCHFREEEKRFLDKTIKEFGSMRFSAASHSVEEAEKLLKNELDFVFLSPVFPPYSKKIDYTVLDFNLVRKVVSFYGERVVLLGGMDFDRVEELRVKLDSDFSFGGITCFFGGEK